MVGPESSNLQTHVARWIIPTVGQIYIKCTSRVYKRQYDHKSKIAALANGPHAILERNLSSDFSNLAEIVKVTFGVAADWQSASQDVQQPLKVHGIPSKSHGELLSNLFTHLGRAEKWPSSCLSWLLQSCCGCWWLRQGHCAQLGALFVVFEPQGRHFGCWLQGGTGFSSLGSKLGSSTWAGSVVPALRLLYLWALHWSPKC